MPRALLVCLGSKQQSQSSMLNLDPDLDGSKCSGLSFKGISTPLPMLLAAPLPPRFCNHFSIQPFGSRCKTRTHQLRTHRIGGNQDTTVQNGPEQGKPGHTCSERTGPGETRTHRFRTGRIGKKREEPVDIARHMPLARSADPLGSSGV